MVFIPLFLLMIALWDQSSSIVAVTQTLFIGCTGTVIHNKSGNKLHDDVQQSQKKGGSCEKVNKKVDSVISRFIS
jgi:hypothetical protein